MAVELKITSFEVSAGHVATETNLVRTSALQGLTSICAVQFLIIARAKCLHRLLLNVRQRGVKVNPLQPELGVTSAQPVSSCSVKRRKDKVKQLQLELCRAVHLLSLWL